VGADVIQPLHLKLSDAELKVKPSTIEHNRKLMAEQGWVDNGDGTATNSKTGLTWKRCYEGQTWTGSTCSGAPKGYTRDEAKKMKSSFVGKTDWRLPSIDELHTIVYCTDGRRPIQRDKNGEVVTINGEDANGECLGKDFQRPTVNLAVFPMQNYESNPDEKYYPNVAWSASPGAVYAASGLALYVNLYSGFDDWSGKPNHAHPVRLVRGQ